MRFGKKTGHNPFQPSIHENKIFGLGSADTKLDFLCKLFAARKFIGKKTKNSFVVVGTFGEEYNMQGAIRLIRHKFLRPQKALVGEPTQLQLVYSGKGMANVEITLPFSQEEIDCRQKHDLGESQSAQCKIFRGRPTHSSQPQKGVNAIEKLIEYLEQLPEQILVLEIDGGTNHNTIPTQAALEFDLIPMQNMTVNQKIVRIYKKIENLKAQFGDFKDTSFDPPVTTLNIGMLRTYSDHLKIMGCVRWPPSVSEEKYMDWMKELNDFISNLGGVFRIRDFKKPFTTTKDSPFVKGCLEAIRQEVPKVALTTQPVTNEANVFHKFAIETLVFGPGQRDGNSQTPLENVNIDDLRKATKIYGNIISVICN